MDKWMQQRTDVQMDGCKSIFSLPFTAGHQFSVELLVTSGTFDGIEELPGLDEVIVMVVVVMDVR